MKSKSLITIYLLAFVIISMVVLIANEFGEKSTSTASELGANSIVSTAEDRLTVYYFHGETRCDTCRRIEAYTNEAVKAAFANELKSGAVDFRVINVETPSTTHFIQDYQLYSSSVVLVLFRDNMQVEWKNLNEVWELVHNKDAFLSYIQDETTAMIQGGF